MIQKAIDFLERKKFNEAIRILHGELKRKPNDTEIYIRLGQAYIGKKDFLKAQKYSTKAIEIDPKLPTPYVTLANISIAQKKEPDEILRFAEKAYNLDPKLDQAIACFGTANLMIRNIDEGIRLLEHAKEISPEKAFIRHNLAIAYSLAKQEKLSFQEFKMANQLEPSLYSRFMVLNSLLSQPDVSKKTRMLALFSGLLMLIIFLLALATHSVILLFLPTIYWLLITSYYLYSLFRCGFSWKTLVFSIIGAIYSAGLIFLITLMIITPPNIAN